MPYGFRDQAATLGQKAGDPLALHPKCGRKTRKCRGKVDTPCRCMLLIAYQYQILFSGIFSNSDSDCTPMKDHLRKKFRHLVKSSWKYLYYCTHLKKWYF